MLLNHLVHSADCFQETVEAVDEDLEVLQEVEVPHVVKGAARVEVKLEASQAQVPTSR